MQFLKLEKKILLNKVNLKNLRSKIFQLIFLLLVSCNTNKEFQERKEKNNLTNLLYTNFLLKNSNESSYNWNLPPGFPTPKVPAENSMSDAKVELGRFLFYDKRLSQNQSQSCSSCHLQNLGFTDGKPVGIGSTGASHPRNSQNLANVAYNSKLTWANNKIESLEQQARLPMFGTSPIELGLTNEEYISRINSDSRYRELFKNAFGEGIEKINEQNIRFALSSFQRSLISGRSRYDKYIYSNDKSALSASEIRGMSIFNGEVAECFHCHGNFNFTDSINHTGIQSAISVYTNNGSKSEAEYSILSNEQKGLYEITLDPKDEGKFKAPSLRNIALTFPYMHDGSFTCTTASTSDLDACATEALAKVIDNYAVGGKSHRNKDTTFIRSFNLSVGEKTDLINFLKSLTDEEFIKNSKHSNPF